MPSYAPHPALRTRILGIDIVESAGGEHLILPSTSAVLGFQFRGRIRAGNSTLSIAGVTGLQSAARTYSYVGNTGSVLVRFTPQGVACLGAPAAELANQNLALEDLIDASRVVQVHEQLQAATDDRARLAAVQRFVLTLPFARDPVVTRALERLAGTPESAISAIARELDISERQLERRFVARVGMMPKRYARLLRFERAVMLARDASSLSTTAQSAGYCDQSHFIRDFRSFVGRAPGEVLVAC